MPRQNVNKEEKLDSNSGYPRRSYRVRLVLIWLGTCTIGFGILLLFVDAKATSTQIQLYHQYTASSIRAAASRFVSGVPLHDGYHFEDYNREEYKGRTPPASYELLTPSYIANTWGQIDDNSVETLHVHALWIGDIENVNAGLERYITRGFNLTIHGDTAEILHGFLPHVRRAYELAIPKVVGYDFLKFLLLYKYGGLIVDADTSPSVEAREVNYSDTCEILFGKENSLRPEQFSEPIYRRVGSATYLFNRPYQLLNWAMLARKPRNRHVAELIDGAMRHFYGRRDMEESLVQDIAGSGLMSDYAALLYAEHGIDYVAAFKDPVSAANLTGVDGLCMLEDELRGGWIRHGFMNTWRQPDSQ